MEPKITSVTVDPVCKGEKSFSVKIPHEVLPGVFVLTADISFKDHVLHKWAEAILEILP